MRTKSTIIFLISLFTLLFTLVVFSANGSKTFQPEDILRTKSCGEARISPDGKWIAYTVSVPRTASEKPGSSYRELYLLSTKNKMNKAFITGKVSIRSINWSPDGSKITFLTRRGQKAKTQVWQIPLSGGEATPITRSPTGLSSYAWNPNGRQIAYITSPAKSKKEKDLAKLGYNFIFYEENLTPKNLYLFDLKTQKTTRLTTEVAVWSFVWSPEGNSIAFAASKKNLIDHRYMFQKIYILDVKAKTFSQLTDNPGKLGRYSFSPDGKKIAYTAAKERKDHAVSQVFVIDINSKNLKNLTIPDFRGHVNYAVWKDKSTILYHSGEGVFSTLSLVPAEGGKRKLIYTSKKTGIAFRSTDFSKDFKHFTFIGSNPAIPGDVFYWRPGKEVVRKTTVNPWIAKRNLGQQKIIRYKTRDGAEVEGLLILPVNYQSGTRYPLIATIHGGPESHYYNTWLTRYSNPGQVQAGRGYAVFYPNYRSSTGYGLKFALTGYEDAAGKEFDDIADGIRYLIKQGIADPERVGLGGGSYGGYASAWFSTYYTKLVKAVCMFVGISDLISKRGTTDIPYEELYVHSGKLLDKMWQESLKRSPIYWAHQSKTAVLIMGGTNDTRVHPSQSLEFYRRLKMNNHPAVRLVQYPGEGHGNRRQPGQIDVLYRTLAWYDWYVKNQKPLDGPMPPLDISDKYGVKLSE